jgi:Flp pilus assembly protein TadB
MEPQRESVRALVGGIVTDARDLASAHLEQIRRESKESVEDLGDSLRAAALTAAAMVVTLVAVSHALAITLVALGAPPWAAYWGVAVLAGAVALLMIRRARARTRVDRGRPGAALERAASDARDII